MQRNAQSKAFDFSDLGEQDNNKKTEFNFSDLGEPVAKNNISQQQTIEQVPQENQSPQPEMVETFLGQMPKELPKHLQRGTKENEEMINNMIEAGIGGPGLGQVVKAPFKLSLKNIANKIIEAKNKEKLFHSGQYKKIFDAAKKSGLDKVRLNTKYSGDVNVIKENSAQKYHAALDKFIKNPTLENAQKAQSDLGKLLNSNQLNKDVLTSEERLTRKSAKNLQDYIKEQMFRDKSGKVNQELKSQYDKISKSYGENFKPYDIKQIKLFEQGKRTPEQLVNSLKSGSFMAERGKQFHPELDRRKTLIEGLKHFGLPVSIAGGGYYLLDKLLGNRD